MIIFFSTRDIADTFFKQFPDTPSELGGSVHMGPPCELPETKDGRIVLDYGFNQEVEQWLTDTFAKFMREQKLSVDSIKGYVDPKTTIKSIDKSLCWANLKVQEVK